MKDDGISKPAGVDVSTSARRVLFLALLIPPEPDGLTVRQMHHELRERGAPDRSLRTIQRDVKVINDCLYDFCRHGLKRTRSLSDEEQWSWPSEAEAIRLGGRDQGKALALAMLDSQLGHMLPASVLQSLQPMIDAGKHLLENSLDANKKHWQQKIAVLQGSLFRKAPAVNPAVMGRINQAVFEERRIEVTFHTAEDRDSGIEEAIAVDPLGLVFDRNIAYMLCRSDQSPGTTEKIPIHRIASAKITSATVADPIRTNLQDLLWRPPGHTNQHKQTVLTISASSELTKELEEAPLGEDQEVMSIGADRSSVSVTVRNDEALRQWLQANVHRCTVLEPTDIRDEINSRLRDSLGDDEFERARRKLWHRREERQLAAQREAWSSNWFWISPWNETVPLRSAHWSDILREPSKYLIETPTDEINSLSRHELLARAVDNHWIPISRDEGQWSALVKDFDDQKRDLLESWLSRMEELGLVEPAQEVKVQDLRSGRIHRVGKAPDPD